MFVNLQTYFLPSLYLVLSILMQVLIHFHKTFWPYWLVTCDLTKAAYCRVLLFGWSLPFLSPNQILTFLSVPNADYIFSAWWYLASCLFLVSIHIISIIHLKDISLSYMYFMLFSHFFCDSYFLYHTLSLVRSVIVSSFAVSPAPGMLLFSQ